MSDAPPTKRPDDDADAAASSAPQARKRSRFDAAPAPAQPLPAVDDAIARAAAAAAAIASQLLSSRAGVTAASAAPAAAPAPPAGSVAAERAAMQAALQQRMGTARPPAAAAAAQTAAGPSSSSFAGAPVQPPPLLLDAQGRPVDASGKLIVEQRKPVTTLRINDPTRPPVPASESVMRGSSSSSSSSSTTTAAASAAAFATSAGPRAASASVPPAVLANPYLAHRIPGAGAAASSSASSASSSAPTDVFAAAAADEARRRKRGMRALHFVEQGTYAAAAEEERERLAKTEAYVALRQKGGRNRPVVHREAVAAEGGAGAEAAAGASSSSSSSSAAAASASASTPSVPPKNLGPLPEMEWWDAAFLPAPRAKLYTAKYSVAGKKAMAAAANPSSSSSSAAAVPAALAAAVAATFSHAELALAAQKASSYVQHPVPVLGGPEPPPAPPLPLMLTKRERKKLRRRGREERQRFILDQIKMGLLPAPEPRVKIGNLMRVLKDAAVADPSAVEARVRAQMAQRVATHELRNIANKLTPQERHEKWKRKIVRHGPSGPDCAVFRVSRLAEDKKARYKVDINAKQLYLAGTVILLRPAGLGVGGGGGALAPGEPGAVVLVEGGTRAVNTYTKLMLRRVNWNRIEQERKEEGRDGGSDDEEDEEEEDDDDDEDSEEEDEEGRAKGTRGAGPGGKCELLWRGTVPKAHFADFRFEECRSAAVARQVLEAKGLAHFWDNAVASQRAAAGIGGGEEGGMEEEEGGALGAGFVRAATSYPLPERGAGVGAGAGAGKEGEDDESAGDSDDSELMGQGQ
jgi:U4/U6 small nuclear ribonucleoprotein PRP3